VVHYEFFLSLLRHLTVTGLVYIAHLGRRRRDFPQVDHLFIRGDDGRMHDLRAHYPRDIIPVVMYSRLFEHMPNGIQHTIIYLPELLFLRSGQVGPDKIHPLQAFVQPG
jgi:hypothetical protein